MTNEERAAGQPAAPADEAAECRECGEPIEECDCCDVCGAYDCGWCVDCQSPECECLCEGNR